MKAGLVVIALVSLTAGAVSAQPARPSGPRAPYTLKYLGSFGSSEFRADAALDSLTRAAGGDSFGRVSDMALSPDKSQLFVLDNVARKLVSVRPQGPPRVVLTWRSGRGPGEFTRPRAVAVIANGFSIADDANARMSFFTADGRFARSVPFPGSAYNVRSNGRSLTALRFSARPGRYQIVHLSIQGEVVDSAMPIAGRLADFALSGEPGILFHDRHRAVHFASPAAGVICTITQPTRCSGQDIFPQIKSSIRRTNGMDVRGVNLSVRGAAQLESGHFVILAFTMDHEQLSQNNSDWYRAWLLILDSQMKYVGYMPAPDGWLIGMIAGFAGQELLFATDEPYPQVLRYALQPSR